MVTKVCNLPSAVNVYWTAGPATVNETHRDAFNDELRQKLLPADLLQILNIRLLFKCFVLHVFKK